MEAVLRNKIPEKPNMLILKTNYPISKKNKMI